MSIYHSVNFSANNLREDYKLYHTFSTEIAKFLKVSLGKLIVMQPEKFQSKYEPRSNVMDIQVSGGPSSCRSDSPAQVPAPGCWCGMRTLIEPLLGI